MFDYRHYVPVLKGKDGEFKALEHLQSNARDRLTPFIDIPRRDLDPKTKQPKDSIDIYLVSIQKWAVFDLRKVNAIHY